MILEHPRELPQGLSVIVGGAESAARLRVAEALRDLDVSVSLDESQNRAGLVSVLLLGQQGATREATN